MASYWTEQIHGAYCERTSDGFWAEPLNAASSLAIIFVAVATIPVLLRYRPLPFTLVALYIFGLATSIGSFLLHTFATRWSELTDVIPIWGFVGLYCVVAAQKLGRNRISMPVASIAALLIFGVGTALAMNNLAVLKDGFSGSSQYMPAVIMLIYVVQLMRQQSRSFFGGNGAALICIAFAFGFRSIDLPLCDVWPAGTHFMWHVCNCLAFWLLLRTMLVENANQRDPSAKTATNPV